MNNVEVYFLTTNMIILGLPEILFQVMNRIELSESPICIKQFGKYKKTIVLYFYISLMLRLQVEQSDGSFSRYAVTLWVYVGRFSRLKTSGVGTIKPNSDAAPIKTYHHAQNSFPDHKYRNFCHFCHFVGIFWA